jgi:methionyl-tRNA formyltransferase
MKLAPSPVKQLALEHGLSVATPLTLSRKRDASAAEAALELLIAVRPDVLVVAAYGLILPQAVLDVPGGLGDAGSGPVRAINIHASLLPRWRGAAPVARAIEAGDAATGITLMQMDAGLDTGPMLLARAISIAPTETTAALTQRLADLGAEMIIEGLDAGARSTLRATPQPVDGVTYANKLDKSEARLDWNEPATRLARRVRAFDPFPVAAARLGELDLKIWYAEARPGTGQSPGTVVAADRNGLRVACGEGELLITQLQRAGGRRLSVSDFLAGVPVAKGARFSLPGST